MALARNSGLAAGLQRRRGAARGELLVMLNNDTEAEPGWLAALVAAAARTRRPARLPARCCSLTGAICCTPPAIVMGATASRATAACGSGTRASTTTSRSIFGGCGGGVAYRREAWEQAGGFDERLFMYLEDVDLAWRLQLLGWEAVFAPEARLYHQLSATGGGVLASYYTGRNTIWVIAKDMPGPLMRRHLGASCGHSGASPGRAARLAGPAARARLRGQLAGLIGLPRVWAGAGRRRPLARRPSPRSVVCSSTRDPCPAWRYVLCFCHRQARICSRQPETCPYRMNLKMQCAYCRGTLTRRRLATRLPAKGII